MKSCCPLLWGDFTFGDLAAFLWEPIGLWLDPDLDSDLYNVLLKMAAAWLILLGLLDSRSLLLL